jgi:catechol 2,3-dioxygenase-like lactoylglutathione lyase family enzyme
MLPVSDLERSLAFYAEFFGLREIRRIELEQPTRTLVFIGTASADPKAMQLELWYEPGQSVQPISGHIGIGVTDPDGHEIELLS